jgi:hypothetical protein
VSFLFSLWSYPLSFTLTFITGVLLFWQYPGAKGTAGHITRWAVALLLSVFVVYMNTVTVMNQPRVRITNPWHIRLMGFHQNVGLIYFALMALMPLPGICLLIAGRRGWRVPAALRGAHRWLGYAAGITWLASNIASEIGSRIPRA